MADPAESAVGAILHIDDKLLDKIDKAEKMIKSLGQVSEETAKAVSSHWSTTAIQGFDTFIKKIAEVNESIRSINGSNINLSVNTQPLENQLNNASDAAKKTASDVSSAVQTLAIQDLDFSNITRLSESIMALDGTYKQVENTIKSLERGRAVMATESTEAQATTNMIQLLKEYLELKKKSEEQQKTKTAVFDQNLLDEQKTLLQQILQYQKDINAETTRQQRVTKLGGTVPQEDIDRLEEYDRKLKKLTETYNTLKGKIDQMSAAGQKRFNKADIDYELARAREQTSADEKRGQALQMVSKYLSDIKLKSAGISSREEGVYMNEQVAVYQQMIAMIKKRGEVEAQVASQGYAQTSAQANLLQTIQTEYDRLEASLSKVTGKYTEIDRAVSNAFGKAQTMQEAENAAKLADAYQKAAEAAQKRADADAKAEAKAIAAGEKVIAQKEAQIAKQEAADQRAAQNYEKWWLSALDKRADAEARTNQALASEYKKLITRLQEVNDAMNKYQAAGGSVNTGSFKAMEKELAAIMARRKEIEKMDIAEVNQYRRQMAQSAYQAELSAFVQMEAQKRAEQQRTINEQMAKARQAAQQYMQSYTGAMKQFDNLMSGRGGGKLTDTYENRARVIKNLEAAIKNLNKADSDYENKLKNLTDALQRLQSAQKGVNDAIKQAPKKLTVSDANQAVKIAQQTKTLKDYETAYKMLLEVMKQTPQGRSWDIMNSKAKELKQNIDEIKKAMGEMRSESSKTSSIMGGLKDKIAATFSVAAIQGFIKKMVEVRAQFELQRVALGAILQDKDKADKIFLQVQQMALESPFSIMQLERATKQIAAFGFEADKLKPTLKMLADMSAGLGVEIDRLVLVMGHLKARNYLEGCLGFGTPIKMADGSVKRVEDIVQGESIMGDDDTPRIVKQVIRGNEQMYKVSYADGSFRCNEKHILTLYNTDKDAIEDVYVLDYLKKTDAYKGVRRADGQFEYFDIAVEKDVADNYYGFVIDGNRRFQLGDGVVTHNTMVRQFTNAGFNVLGELAKYYTELEGRMVSVAEVQTRVKKKMVEFGDVEEVLKRVTSAGGMFYDMQKKQSDSLWGQMQRITDAYDLMLNEIGKDNQNMISKALTAIRALINSWRTLAPMIKTVGYAMAAVFAAKGVTMLLSGFTALGTVILKLPKYINNITAAIRTMNLAWSTTGIGLLVATLFTAVEIFRGARAEANALRKELDRIGGESVKSVNESIVNFKNLADTLSDATKSYAERNNALQELKRVYHDVLPQEKLEWDYIVGLNGDYKELTKTIVDYYSAKEYQHKYEAVMGSKQAKDVTDELERAYKRMNKEGAFGMIFPENQIKEWAQKVATELNTGQIPSSIEALAKRTRDIFGENIDVSKYIIESYGKADFTDVIDKVEKVKKEVNDLSVSVPLAENAVMALNESFANMDAAAATQKFEEIKGQIQAVKDSIARLSGTALTADPFKYDKIAQYKAELESLNVSLDAVSKARAKIIAQDVQKKIDNEVKVLTDLVSTWWKNNMAMESLALQGKSNTKAYKDLESAQKRIVDSAPQLESSLGVKIPWAMVKSAQTTYDLQQQLDVLSTQAFPNAAKAAMDKMSDVERSVLNAKTAMDSFLQGLKDIIPENWAEGFNTFAQALGFTTEKAEDATDAIAGIYSDLAKNRANQFGADISELNKILDKNLGRGEAAKKVRDRVDELNKALKSFDTSTAQEKWLKLEDKTKQEIEQMRKDVKALEAFATDLDGVNDKTNKGAQGKDPELEMWKNRIKAVQDYFTVREKARKNLSANEAETQQLVSFDQLWKELKLDKIKGLSLNDLIMKGFDPKTLQADLVSALEKLKALIPEKYEDIRKEVERTIAKESIEVEFKIKEGEREQLQKSITDLFDNYTLTKELSNLGVNVDLTYMVGGKPTTLADIRKEYERLMVGFASKSEEEQKTIKKMGEDLQKKEFDNRKQQLKNYVKYLTESMGERAQIEIKAIQDVNKLREDETLDSFSKEQAIMQRRKKMYEDLSKMDLDSLKSSDVYISVFKDLETASKEQLQYVLNKLRELQSTFKDLSPAQVKSIANEMKKIEDALASKGSVKNMFGSLKDAIKYSKQRNDLLKKQTDLQESVEANSKMLSDAELYLTDLELERKSIQDESSEEWEVANERVLKQQDIVKQLQDYIEELKKKLAEVTEKINEGENAWKKWKSAIGQIRTGMNQVKDSLDATFNGLDSIGLVSDAFRDTYESIGEIIGGLDTFMNGLESIDIAKPFSIITGSIKSIGGVFSTIGGFFGIGDKKKERQIKKLTEKVETLDKAYQKLEKSIESAYTFDDYNAGYKQMQQNLEAQKTAYEEMIRLEDAKKKTDKNKIKEYQDKLEEIAEAQDELRKQRIEAMGSTTDYLNEAESFVNAWLEAYKEVGDGTDALIEQWDDFLSNLFVKQAAAQIISTRVKNLIADINKAIEDGKTDYDLKQMVRDATDKMKEQAPIWNELLTNLADAYGLKGGKGELILSDLQKGIQNITEPQAAAIEAYLNSMRFAVFRHTEQLDTLIATIQSQYGSGAENPVVTELKGIRGVLDSIDKRLGSVIKSNAGKTYVQVG